jgi:hypothetical protein
MALFYTFSLVMMLIGAFGLAFIGSWAFTVIGGLVGFILGACLGNIAACLLYAAILRRLPRSAAKS